MWRQWWCNRGPNDLILHNLPSTSHIWSQIDAILYKTWISEIPENSFDFSNPEELLIRNQNQNLSALEKFPVNHILCQYWFPRCAVKTDRITENLHFDPVT